MHSLPDLTLNQFSLVYNFLSFTIAAMLAGFVFFVLSRPTLAERYRPLHEHILMRKAKRVWQYSEVFTSRTGAQTRMALLDPGDRLCRSRGRKGQKDADVVQREKPADVGVKFFLNH